MKEAVMAEAIVSSARMARLIKGGMREGGSR